MRWQEGGESENVEDQRQLPVGMALGGAGTVIVVVIALLLGKNPLALLQQVQNQAAPPGVRAPRQDSPEEARKVSFVKHVLFQTEQVWTDLFERQLQQHLSQTRSWFCSPAGSTRPAGWPMRPWALSIARPTRRSTSTSNSMTS